MVTPLFQDLLYVLTFIGVIVIPFGRAFGGAILCLLVALLLRSAPYTYWHWQGGQILELLKLIRGGHAEKFTLSVANCPGLFLPSSTEDR